MPGDRLGRQARSPKRLDQRVLLNCDSNDKSGGHLCAPASITIDLQAPFPLPLDIIDAWLERLTRPSGIPQPTRDPRCDNMAEDAATEDAAPPPVANPDAQTTVNDFLDYTEFFPSYLIRSLRLIGDLDQTYVDATQAVHQLTVKYGKLPELPQAERPDPVLLRRDIAHALDKALYARESSFAEASRLFEVAERHKHRIGIIKRKLQAQPEPPSRDPTPVPVSPQASRALNRNFATPHLRLTFDGRHGNSTVRAHDRKQLLRAASFSDSDDSDARSTADLAAAKRLKDRSKDKTPRPPKVRLRAPGTGTNVHSSLAGISTSNALARLSPPPDNPRPGSRWAPWLKLTEYEMAVLRKKMKKNAVWTPSETMIKRVLESTGRGQEAYEREKKRCEATGEELLDEEPALPSIRSANPPAAFESMSVAGPAPSALPADSALPDVFSPSTELQRDVDMGDDDSVQDALDFKDTRQSKRDSRRREAARDLQVLGDTSRKIKEAAEIMQEITFVPAGAGKKPAAKPSNKRKRDSSPPPVTETPVDATREASLASQDSTTKPPEMKRLRLHLPVASGGASTPQNLTPVAPSPDEKNTVLFPDANKTTTVQVPLAPAGPETPRSAGLPSIGKTSQPGTPAVRSPAVATATEAQVSPTTTTTTTVPAPSNVTAASSRPRRESVAPPKEKPTSPTTVSAPTTKKQKAATPVLETTPPLPGQTTRSRPSRPSSSRGHVPTPKAQSEEPKLNEGQTTRELRRHSIFSQSALAAPAPAPTRTSTRRKAPPKGEITNGEGGQKTVTNVNRAQGNKNKKKKKPEEGSEPTEEIDQDEERYCICDDVSYGSMILCDNHVSAGAVRYGYFNANPIKCEKEWFHLDCVGLKDGELPARRAKWYCPDCREVLGTDAYGNPKVPPPLPGRRGNR